MSPKPEIAVTPRSRENTEALELVMPAHSVVRGESNDRPFSKDEINRAIQADPSLLSHTTLGAVIRNLTEKQEARVDYYRRVDLSALNQEAQIEYFLAKEFATWMLESVFNLRVVENRPISESIRVVKRLLEEEKNVSRLNIIARATKEFWYKETTIDRFELITVMEGLAVDCENLEARKAALEKDIFSRQLAHEAELKQMSAERLAQITATEEKIAESWGAVRNDIVNYEERKVALLNSIGEQEKILEELKESEEKLVKNIGELKDNPELIDFIKSIYLLGGRSSGIEDLLRKSGVSEDLIKRLSYSEYFSEIYSSRLAKLELRETELGREVRLTLNRGSSIRGIFDEINEKMNSKYPRSKFTIPEYFYEDYGDTRVKLTNKKTITFIAVLKNSANRKKYGIDSNISHKALLKELNMYWVDVKYLVAAAGMFRVMRGYAPNFEKVTESDIGDLFEGHQIRAKKDIVYSSASGIHPIWITDETARKNLFLAGLSKQQV